MTLIPIPCPHCGAVLKVRDPKLIGNRVKCPKCAQPFRLQEPAAVGAAVAETAAESPPEQFGLPTAAGSAPGELPQWPAGSEPLGAVSKLQAQRKRNRKRTIIASCTSAAVLLIGGLAAFYVVNRMPKPLVDDVVEEEFLAEEPVEEVANADEPAAENQPIDLKYIPAGTRILVHLRPAELWQPDSQGEEFRFCLGPISEFVEGKIKELTKREPAEITDALFCVIPAERGTPPDLAAVFHLKSEAKKSQLLDEFSGKRVEASDDATYYQSGELAYVFPDLKTIVVSPARLADDMVAAMHNVQPTAEGISELLFLTDRRRPVTVVFDPMATMIDAEFLLPPSAVPILNSTIDWFGSEVDTVAWSLQFQKELFRSEIVVRNKGGLEARILERDLKRNLDGLAEDVLGAVKRMAPREQGKRQIIGRVPAMTKAVALGTRTSAGPRYVKLTTLLPERAAPNLALGTLLAWDESTRTDFKAKPVPSSTDDKPDNTPIAEKLKRKITVEFKREPLQQAFDYIANEIKAKLEVDGDGLKLSAYTKNMPQSFAMENVSAISVIERILKQPMYDKMCMVVDEKKNSLLITTYPVAEEKGLKPYEFDK